MEVEFKHPSQENGTKNEDQEENVPTVENGKTTPTKDIPPSPSDETKPKKRQKRSRSKTPLKKASKRQSGDTITLKPVDETVNGESDIKEIEPAINGTNEDVTTPQETDVPQDEEAKDSLQDMDPLVLVADEPDPELQFDENSDMESGKGSPVITRCKTRRSQTRNIPTPKTPKSLDEEVEKVSVPPTPDLVIPSDETVDSNCSTKVEVGGDSTRIDYTGQESELWDNSEYLNSTRNQSLGETLKSLSSRRPIRSISRDYRKLAIKSNFDKNDLNIPKYNSLDRVHGVKRKDRSETPEDRKKFKYEATGLITMISSPLASLRNRFLSADIPSSTPKLTGYKDKNSSFEESTGGFGQESNGDGKRNWCTIM